MVSDLERHQTVSLSRSQTSLVSVVSAPSIPDEPYTVGLPIDSVSKSFTTLGQPGETVEELAAKLEQVLLSQQTPFSVVATGADLVVVGPKGIDFDVELTANMTHAVVEPAFLRINHQTGEPYGDLRVLESESTSFKLREFSTRTPAGDVVTIQTILVREINTANVFEVTREEILDPPSP